MLSVGLAGKPNSGKSTFFKAATLVEVDIANYPFTTIDANHGVSYVRVPCPCKELGIKEGVTLEALNRRLSDAFPGTGVAAWNGNFDL